MSGRAVRSLLAAISLVSLVGCSAGGEVISVDWPDPSPSPTAARSGASPGTDPSVAAPTTPRPEDEQAMVAQAQRLLPEIPIKGRAPKTGYDREKFGQRWADVDRNGCDQRNDVLTRDLTDRTYRSAASCAVATGVLDDPYTGRSITFTRGQDTSTAVQIDHVVSLSNAWQTGASSWDEQQREAFANDAENLLAVDGPTNLAKSDGDAATWLPPHRDSWCSYTARQTVIKDQYGLWMTPPEHDRITEILTQC